MFWGRWIWGGLSMMDGDGVDGDWDASRWSAVGIDYSGV